MPFDRFAHLGKRGASTTRLILCQPGLAEVGLHMVGQPERCTPSFHDLAKRGAKAAEHIPHPSPPSRNVTLRPQNVDGLFQGQPPTMKGQDLEKARWSWWWKCLTSAIDPDGEFSEHLNLHVSDVALCWWHL